MLSREIANLENDNRALKDELEELKKKMEQGTVVKPKSCQYCRNYIQHYRKAIRSCSEEYIPINDGHCLSGVPISKGGKKRPKPHDTCQYFEFGTRDVRNL